MHFWDVFVRPIPGSVESWMCGHISSPESPGEGEIVLCNACTNALQFDGAKLINAETRKPFIEVADAELQEPFMEPDVW